MGKQIICKNEDNVQTVFGYDFTPFFLVSAQGMTSVYNNVAMVANTMTDGSTLQGSTTLQRNIVLTAQMCSHYQENRDLLYRTFKPKSPGTLTYTESGESRTISYQVESLEIGEVGVVRDVVISLLCPDPFFLAMDDTVIDMSTWESLFFFEHEFLEEGEALGERVSEIIKTIDNDSAAKNIGITVTLAAEGPVENPAIYHLESGDFVRVNLALQAGEAVIITTETNNKNVYLLKNGVQQEINQLLDEESEFIQLSHGMNTLKYDTQSGLDYLSVRVCYRFRYLGV